MRSARSSAGRHAPFLIAFATKLTGSRADADDCVQDALITAWQKLPDLEDPSKARAWLTTIVSRNATSRMRSRRPADSIDDVEVESDEPGPERSAIASSQLDALNAALQTRSKTSPRISIAAARRRSRRSTRMLNARRFWRRSSASARSLASWSSARPSPCPRGGSIW
ncbi:MAG: sigma-70 family RNA polymerase sigma factor [Microbacterium sp.]|nr:sigma-70 family RNA polymerase sigma factor [Microbacterium sp.]MDO8382119.1 sigma-70 family RNA polymerase sigma factor [Microbacterium sp.]